MSRTAIFLIFAAVLVVSTSMALPDSQSLNCMGMPLLYTRDLCCHCHLIDSPSHNFNTEVLVLMMRSDPCGVIYQDSTVAWRRRRTMPAPPPPPPKTLGGAVECGDSFTDSTVNASSHAHLPHHVDNRNRRSDPHDPEIWYG